jgi:hypothetical protein
MAVLTPVVLSRSASGAVLTGVAPTAGTGDTWANTGQECILIRNGSGSPINVTVDIIATLDGNVVTDPVISVAAGAITCMGPYPTGLFNDGTNVCKVTCSSVATVTIAILKQVL